MRLSKLYSTVHSLNVALFYIFSSVVLKVPAEGNSIVLTHAWLINFDSASSVHERQKTTQMHWQNQINVYEIFLHINGQVVLSKCQDKMDKNLVFLLVFYTGSLDFFTLFFFPRSCWKHKSSRLFPFYHWNKSPNILRNQFCSHNVHVINEGKRERKRGILFIYSVLLYHCVAAYRVFVLLHLKHLCLKSLRYENAIEKMETQSTEDNWVIFQNK